MAEKVSGQYVRLMVGYRRSDSIGNLCHPLSELVWIRALELAKSRRSDGRLPLGLIRRDLCADLTIYGLSIDELISDLAAAGLWAEVEPGVWQLANWAKWQQTVDEEAHRRSMWVQQKRAQRSTKPQVNDDVRADSARTPRGVRGKSRAEQSRAEHLSTYAAAKALRTRGDEIAAAETLCIEIAKTKAARAIASGDAANPAAYGQHLLAEAVADYLPRVRALLELGTPPEQIIEQLSAPPKRASRRRKPTVAELLQGDGT